VFRACRKLLKESDILQLYDNEFQTDGALTLKAFADNASVIRSVVQTVIVYQLIAGCEIGGSF